MRSPRMAGLAKAIVASLLWSASALAVPPPPPPPGWIDFGTEVPKAYRENDIERYLALFAADVVLVKDGREIGRGIATVRSDFLAEKAMGWRIAPVAVASGGNEVLLMEKVTNIPERFDGQVHDCCFWFRSIRYRIGDTVRIDRIDILTAQAASRLALMPPGL